MHGATIKIDSWIVYFFFIDNFLIPDIYVHMFSLYLADSTLSVCCSDESVKAG
jgi:hypothetical protein